MTTSYLPLSWNAYHAYIRKLAATILAHESKLDEIVAISRGGLTFGHILSDYLRIPISIIAIQSYTDIQEHGEAKLTVTLQKSIMGKNILLADDISDTGTTFVRAMKYLKPLRPAKIVTSAVYYKPHSVFRPDYVGAITKKWILFPYEPTEMILLLTGKLTKEGKTKAQIQQFLEKLGYTADQIAFVRRHHLK